MMREAGVEQMAKMVNSMDASKLREILDDRGIDHTDCPTKVRREVVAVKRVVCCCVACGDACGSFAAFYSLLQL